MASIKIASLWVNEDRNGKKYLGGPFGYGRMRVIKNNFKKLESDPDYVVMIESSAPGEADPETLDFED